MNAAAAAALYEAERNGMRQIKGRKYSTTGGACAVGVLYDAGLQHTLARSMDGCPLCGARISTAVGPTSRKPWRLDDEATVICHLNDDHGLTFSEIARKLGPDSL